MVKSTGSDIPQKFELYTKQNQVEVQKTLCEYMITSNTDVERVCEKLIKGIKIRKTTEFGKQYDEFMAKGSSKKRGPAKLEEQEPPPSHSPSRSKDYAAVLDKSLQSNKIVMNPPVGKSKHN